MNACGLASFDGSFDSRSIENRALFERLANARERHEMVDAKQIADAVSQNLQRQAIVDTIVKEKFGGDAELTAYLPKTGDAKALHAEADKVVETFRRYNPNFGKPERPIPGLSEGLSAHARSLKLPK